VTLNHRTTSDLSEQPELQAEFATFQPWKVVVFANNLHVAVTALPGELLVRSDAWQAAASKGNMD